MSDASIWSPGTTGDAEQVNTAEAAAIAAAASAAAALVSQNASAASAAAALISENNAETAQAAAEAAAALAQSIASVGFDTASTIYDFGLITDPAPNFQTDYGSVV